jgi:hypothetical protein
MTNLNQSTLTAETVKQRPFFMVNDQTKELLDLGNQLIVDALYRNVPMVTNEAVTGMVLDRETVYHNIIDLVSYKREARYSNLLSEAVYSIEMLFHNLNFLQNKKNLLNYLKLSDFEGNSLNKYLPLTGIHALTTNSLFLENNIEDVDINVFDTAKMVNGGVCWYFHQGYINELGVNDVAIRDSHDGFDEDNNDPHEFIVIINSQLVESDYTNPKINQPNSRDWKFDLLKKYRTQKHGKQLACSMADKYPDVFALWAGLAIGLPYERIAIYLKQKSDYHQKDFNEKYKILNQMKPLIEQIGLDFNV